MGNQVINRSIDVKGDIGAVFDALRKSLVGLKFTESAITWPTNMELRRGKGGIFVTKIHDCKTVLKVSLKQAGDNVDMLLDYNISLKGLFTGRDKEDIEAEILKIKHDLIGLAPQSTKDEILCDVCLTPIKKGENFCSNCGRSTTRQKAPTSAPEPKLEVMFDPNKVAFGVKIVDDVLYGGIPNNSSVLVTSMPCEEKDLMVTRFIETGLDQSENVVYISTDDAMMKNQKCSQKEKFFQVVCSAQADLMVAEGVKNITKVKGIDHLTELSMALTSLLNNISNSDKPGRLVLNILSDMLLSSQSLNTRKWMRETITKFKIKNFTILGILNPHMHSKEDANALLDLFDGQIDLYEKEEQGTAQMYMRVKRMNNAKYSSKETMLPREELVHRSA